MGGEIRVVYVYIPAYLDHQVMKRPSLRIGGHLPNHPNGLSSCDGLGMPRVLPNRLHAPFDAVLASSTKRVVASAVGSA